MAQSESDDDEMKRVAAVEDLLDDLPNAWTVETHAGFVGPAETTRRTLWLQHDDGTDLLVSGSERRGFAVYHRAPDERIYSTALRSRLSGRRRIVSWEQAVDRATALAVEYAAGE